jgi:hypothetical protein
MSGPSAKELGSNMRNEPTEQHLRALSFGAAEVCRQRKAKAGESY